MVANSTQGALVRFLCRLKGTDLPVGSTASSPDLETVFGSVGSSAVGNHRELDLPPHQHAPSQITPEACRVLEDEFVTGIVLGLARLDDDERDGERGMDGIEGSSQIGSEGSRQRQSSSRSDDDGQSITSLVLSPEEEQIEDGWITAASANDPTPGPTSEGWGEPLVPYFDNMPELAKNDYGQHSLLSSQPMYSSFSPDCHGDEESSIGKLVSMSLIAAIAATDCLDPDVLVEHILPEVERMKAESMFYVRKEAVQALGSLARTLPIEIFEAAVVSILLSGIRFSR